MDRLQEAIGLGWFLYCSWIIATRIQRSGGPELLHRKPMTSHTETTSTVTETINSMDYNTGYQYSVTGGSVEPTSGILSPTTGDVNVTIEGEFKNGQSHSDTIIQTNNTRSSVSVHANSRWSRFKQSHDYPIETTVTSVTDTTKISSQQ